MNQKSRETVPTGCAELYHGGEEMARPEKVGEDTRASSAKTRGFHTQRGNATIKRTPQTARIQKGHRKLSNLNKMKRQRSVPWLPGRRTGPGRSQRVWGKTSPGKLLCRFDPWVGKIPGRKKWQPTLLSLPGESPWTEEPGRLQSMGSQKGRLQSMGSQKVRCD